MKNNSVMIAQEHTEIISRPANDQIYKDFFDLSLDGAYRTDSNGVFIMINKAGARMLGHDSAEEVLGRKAEDYWADPADRSAFSAELKSNKTVSAYLMQAKKIDGTGIVLEASCRILENDRGDFLGIEGILRDVTEKIRADNELRINQEKFIKKHEELNRLFKHVEMVKKEWERTMDCTSDMIILTDNSGKIKRCNRSLKEFTGLPYEEILWKDWAELLEEFGLTTSTMFEERIELFHEASGRWFVLNSNPFTDENSSISGNVITIHDTTELRKITDELKIKNNEIISSRNNLQLALDKISSLTLKVAEKKDFSVRYRNPNLKKCYELMNCQKADCPCYGKEAMRCWQTAGTYCKGNIKGIFAEKYMNCVECPMFKDSTTDPIYQIGEHFNNMMHILETKNNELHEAYNQLKDTQSKILQQEKMASIGQLAAGIAHEVNNPIGFISSNLGTLDKYTCKLIGFINAQSGIIKSLENAHEAITRLEDDRRKIKLDYIIKDIGDLIKESLDGADRVKKIVQDLKNFSRVDEAEHKMADINSGIESTINIVWNELKYKTTMKKEYGDIPTTKCNPGQLNQVFMNMLVNAAHAIEKQGVITVKTWHENDFIYISISDTGSGIPEDKLSRIFEPFFTTKEVGKGTGLGLSIAYDIIKKHKGEISVQSKQGEGTTFCIKIPVIEKG